VTVAADMKAAVWHGPGDLRFERTTVPAVVPGSLLVKVRSCAVCGSDLRIFSEGNSRIEPPRIIGHEIAGEIAGIGENVSGYSIGDRVSVGADVPCGKCAHCAAGRPNNCDVNLAIGHQFDGGFAEYVLLEPVVVELGPIRKFNANLDFDMAALAEPLACCLNGYERALIKPGAVVVIFGAGPIGIMLAGLAPTFEASRVIVVEPSPHRREFVRNTGVGDVIDPTETDPVDEVMQMTGGGGGDAIFTACLSVEAHEQAIAMVAKRGVVNLFGGLPKSAPPISFFSNHLHYREAYVTGSHGSTPRQHKKALEFLDSGAIDLRQLISRTYPLEEIGAAFEDARSGASIKVVVHPSD